MYSYNLLVYSVIDVLATAYQTPSYFRLRIKSHVTLITKKNAAPLLTVWEGCPGASVQSKKHETATAVLPQPYTHRARYAQVQAAAHFSGRASPSLPCTSPPSSQRWAQTHTCIRAAVKVKVSTHADKGWGNLRVRVKISIPQVNLPNFQRPLHALRLDAAYAKRFMGAAWQKGEAQGCSELRVLLLT